MVPYAWYGMSCRSAAFFDGIAVTTLWRSSSIRTRSLLTASSFPCVNYWLLYTLPLIWAKIRYIRREVHLLIDYDESYRVVERRKEPLMTFSIQQLEDDSKLSHALRFEVLEQWCPPELVSG